MVETVKFTKKEDCIFCKIIRGEIPVEKVCETDNFIVINDAHPETPGHCLILTKKHYATLLDMPDTLGVELIKIAKQQALRLINEKKVTGFKFNQNNFQSAGQVVPHVHFHIIPRK
jgi:histidine triad (HIT) family protein